MKTGFLLLVLLLPLAARAQSAPPAGSATLDSLRVPTAVLYYRSWGPATAEPVLLLTGGPGAASTQLDYVAEKLSTTRRCLVLDQRGTGRTRSQPLDSTTVTLAQYVADVAALQTHLGAAKITIVGHSWGSALAMAYAVAFPHRVRQLVLIGPAPLSSAMWYLIGENRVARATADEFALLTAVADSTKRHLPTHSTARIRWRYSFFDARQADSLRTAWAPKNRANQLIFPLMEADFKRHPYDLHTGLARLKIPLQVICGRQDPVGVFPAFDLLATNPRHARVQWLERCGHFPWLERPAAFYAALLPLLAPAGASPPAVSAR